MFHGCRYSHENKKSRRKAGTSTFTLPSNQAKNLHDSARFGRLSIFSVVTRVVEFDSFAQVSFVICASSI